MGRFDHPELNPYRIVSITASSPHRTKNRRFGAPFDLAPSG